MSMQNIKGTYKDPFPDNSSCSDNENSDTNDTGASSQPSKAFDDEGLRENNIIEGRVLQTVEKIEIEIGGDGAHFTKKTTIGIEPDGRSKKRVAPLSFNFSSSEANPALRFDEETPNENGFFSPLESAFINNQHGLISPNSLEEGGEVDDGCDDDADHKVKEDNNHFTVKSKANGDNDGSESRGWWSRFLHSNGQQAGNVSEVRSRDESETMKTQDPLSLQRAISGDGSVISFQSAKSQQTMSSSESDVGLFPDLMGTLEVKNVITSSSSKGNVYSSLSNENSTTITTKTRYVPKEERKTYDRIGVTTGSSPLRSYDKSGDNSKVFGRTNQKQAPIKKSTICTKKKKKAGVTTATDPNSVVLKEIISHPKDSEFTLDYRSPGTPWTKLIILEELGTASSWVLVFLPYMAFVVALILDADLRLWSHTVGPLSGQVQCTPPELPAGEIATSSWAGRVSLTPGGVSYRSVDGFAFPLNPSSPGSCTYPYQLEPGKGLLSYVERNNEVVDAEYDYLMSSGTALSSGVITGVPEMSTFLYGDVTFTELSNDAVALVARGNVFYSTVVFQKRIGLDQHEAETLDWYPVSVSKPSRLAMVCSLNRAVDSIETEVLSWDCSSPRFLDILFSLPGTSVLTGGDVRVDSLFSYYDSPLDSPELDGVVEVDTTMNLPTKIKSRFSTMSEAEGILSTADLSDPPQLVSDIATSAAFFIQHQRISYAKLASEIRLFTITLSFGFLLFWSWSMGLKGFFHFPATGCCCPCAGCQIRCAKGVSEESLPMTRKKHGVLWWESPWILFPERRYLLLLLFCLIMVQNPLLVYMHYCPKLYSVPMMHALADSLIGIGIHGSLCLCLCLVHGLRYHTAKLARKRAEQQRQVLQLRRAAKYLSQTGNTQYGTNDSASDFTATFYEQYGDTDGSGSVVAVRMKHDPCGDNWPDFLLPKLALFMIGASSIVVAALYRFPGSTRDDSSGPSFGKNAATVSRKELVRDNSVYVISSLVQITVLAWWFYLITKSTFITGARLRKEPFLSTRPAQLAFRVFLGIMVLGMLAIVIPFIIDFFTLIEKWTSNSRPSQTPRLSNGTAVVYSTPSNYYHGTSHSTTDALLRVVIHATKRFPYSGTASSIGPGKIIYITTCVLVAAFIFLPCSSFYESENSQPGVLQPSDPGVLSTRPLVDNKKQRRDKRLVVTLARYTHTWRVFPLPMKRQEILHRERISRQLLSVGVFQIDGRFQHHLSPFGRGIIYAGRYMPVFCLEIACWLFEAAWQAYYSPTEFSNNDWAPGKMNLTSIGLKLDAYVFNEKTHTLAFVASNVSPQVDGEEDSIIVISFRGTATRTNMRTDLNFNQVPLPEHMTGNDMRSEYQIQVGDEHTNWQDHANLDLSTDPADLEHADVEGADDSFPVVLRNQPTSYHDSFPSIVVDNAKAILKATPLARQTLPCVHEGFLEAYSAIRKELLEKLIDVFRRQLDKAINRARKGDASRSDSIPALAMPKIYVSGHSLGGSLAQLLALDVSLNIEIILASSGLSATYHKRTQADRSSYQHLSGVPIDTFDPVDTNLCKGVYTKRSTISSKTPAHARRSSLPSRVSSPGGNEAMTDLSDGSKDFVFAMLSGGGFAEGSESIRLRPPIAVYTYGQPRVGNFAFARLYKQHVPHTFRVVNEGDALTSMPFATFCGGFYKHAGLDVILDEGCTGNTLVGPTVVETLFRFSKMRTNVAAHSMSRYRDNLESALTHDELQEYYRGHGGRGLAKCQSSTDLPNWVTQVRRSVED